MPVIGPGGRGISSLPTSDYARDRASLEQFETLTVFDGQPMPDVPGHTLIATGMEYETYPVQIEYAKVPDSLTLQEGEAPPQLPDGYEYQLSMVLESYPPQFQYELKKPGATPEPSGPSIPSDPFAGFDKTTAFEGEPPPSIPGHATLPTGMVLESFPPQIEYAFVPHKLILEEGESAPQLPDGYEYKLTGILESLPPKYSFELTKTRRSDGNTFEPAPSRPSGTIDAPPPPQQFEETIVVMDGQPMPQAPNGKEYIPTGLVYESYPPQVEYTLASSRVLVRDESELPELPRGYEYVPTGMVYETYPPQSEYKLQKAGETGSVSTPDAPFEPPTAAIDWSSYETLTVFDGEPLPDVQCHVLLPTGMVLESFPPQIEYAKVPTTLTLQEGEQPPQLPDGYEYQLSMVLESYPPQFQYELKTPDSGTGSVDGPADTGSIDPLSYDNLRSLTREYGFETVTARRGQEPNSSRADSVFVATGREFETFPVQLEYLELPATIVLRDGQDAPVVPGGFSYEATGVVFESYPPQFEFARVEN